MEDLTAVTIRNYLSDLRQFMAWCEAGFREEQDEQPFTPEVIAPPLLIRYRTYLQSTLWLKPSSVNRALMSLKRYFAWATSMHVIEHDPTSSVKFVPKEAAIPRHLSDEEERVVVAAVHATGTLRDRAIITLLLHTGLRARELCTLTRKQVHVGKRNVTLRIIGKRNKVRDVPLNATARAVLSEYLETHPSGSVYLFPSEKTQEALTERALGHLITKYAKRAHLVDVSSHDLRHRFGYWMAEVVPLHRLAQIKGHDSLDTTMLYIVERDGTYSATWRKSHGHSSRRPFVNLFSWKHGKSERGKMMLSIFISYAHRDEPLLKELEEHLALLQNQRVITTWHDRDISAGEEWEREIDTHLNTAHIILLLISASFLASKYCYSTEMKRAMERHKAGEACVIPVILRPVDWKGAPFGRLQALPTKAQPITSWSDRDEAFLDVAKGIRDAIEKLMIRSQPRKIALFGYETQGGKSSVLWSDPGTFSLNETYLEWFETKRDFTEREIVNHTWVKAGDHGYSFTVHFLPHGQLHESPLLDPARQLQGSWKRIDGALRTTIEQVEDGALVKYELDIFANRNGSLHSGIESSDSTETAHAYFVFLPSQQLTTKHLEEALAAFDQLLCVNQHCVEAYKAKGNLLRDLGRYKEALDACQRAIELKPDYMWAWHNMGNVLHELRRFEEAFKAYRRTTEIDPSYFWAWHNMGDVLHAMGRLEEALEAFDQAIERDDRIVVTWREKGKTFQDLKRYEEALIAYERALELKPNNAQIWIRKGEVLRALKHYQEAVRAYEQALQLDSKDIDAFLGQGRVYLDLGRYQDALDVYEQATQVASNNTWTWHDKGVALAKLGRVEEALAAFEQAIKLTPENRWAWLHKAETLEYLAQQAYEKAKLQREGIVQGTTTPHSAPILNEYLFDGRNILNATAIKTARVRHDAPGADSPAADVYATFWAHFGSSAQDGKRVFKEGLPGTNAEWDGIWEHVIDGTGETLAMDTNDYVNIVTTEKDPITDAYMCTEYRKDTTPGGKHPTSIQYLFWFVSEGELVHWEIS